MTRLMCARELSQERDDVLDSAQVWTREPWTVAGAGRWIKERLALAINRLLATLTPERSDWHGARRDQAANAAQTSAGAGAPATVPSPEFDAFFAEHERPLYGYVRRLVLGDDVALDIAQEAFVRAWQHFGEVRAYQRPAAWLYRVATNLAISHLRLRLPMPFSQLGKRSQAEAADDKSLGADELLVDPANFAEASAERDLINFVLRRLPERQRAALLLRAVHGFAYDEIAAMLDLSPVAARQTLSRGRERFRDLYAAAQRMGGESHPPH